MIILDIEYEDDYLSDMFVDLNDVIHSKGLMQIEIGTELTRAVKRRYNQIISFDSFFDLQQSCLGKCESLTGNLKGCFSVHLTRNFRLIVKPKSNDLSAESLKRCDILVIKGVIDYHGRGNKINWIIP